LPRESALIQVVGKVRGEETLEKGTLLLYEGRTVLSFVLAEVSFIPFDLICDCRLLIIINLRASLGSASILLALLNLIVFAFSCKRQIGRLRQVLSWGHLSAIQKVES
jgi:hypothetical protein